MISPVFAAWRTSDTGLVCVLVCSVGSEVSGSVTCSQF